MSQQEIGQVGEVTVGQLPELLHVLYHPVPAALGTEVQPGRTVRDRQAVAQMVVAHHGKAPLRQIPGEVLVPQHIFRNAVGDLQDGPGRALRQPLHGVNGSFAVGRRKGKFTFHHGNFLLCMIKYGLS